VWLERNGKRTARWSKKHTPIDYLLPPNTQFSSVAGGKDLMPQKAVMRALLLQRLVRPALS
jgi:hypothetical protein